MRAKALSTIVLNQHSLARKYYGPIISGGMRSSGMTQPALLLPRDSVLTIESSGAKSAGWGNRAEHPRFHLESSSPSGSEQPSPRQPSVAELILHVRERFRSEFAERLANRLDYLAKISQEEYPEQAPIAPESLQDFVAFLESTLKLVYPGVVLTPSGNVQAEWRNGKNRHFAVEFVGSGDVHFVVFAPDPKHSYKTIRASGVATVESLMDIVRPYGVESWATASTRRAA